MFAISRSRGRLFLKGHLYDRLNLAEVVEFRRHAELEQSMGFGGQWDEHRRFQMQLLLSQGLSRHHTLLEIGCGPLTAGIPLIQFLDRNGYIGVDVRPNVLSLAHKEVGKAGLGGKNPRLVFSEVFGRDMLAHFEVDFLLAFSVLFHLDEGKLESFFESVRYYLKPGGQCLANVNTVTDSSHWLEFPFVKRAVSDYSELAARFGLQTTDLGSMGDLGFKLKAEECQNRILSFSLAQP